MTQHVSSANERRGTPRAQIELVIEYTNLEQFCRDYASNLSLGGVFIETRTPLPPATRLKLAFSLPGYEGLVQTTGTVVRSLTEDFARSHGARPGMALQFDDLSSENKAVIDVLVRRSLGLNEP